MITIELMIKKIKTFTTTILKYIAGIKMIIRLHYSVNLA